MKFIQDALGCLPDYKEVLLDIEKGRLPIACFGLTNIHRTVFAAELIKKLGKKGMIILPSEQEAAKVAEDLTSFGIRTLFFPSRDYSPRAAVRSAEYEHIRIGTLSNLLDGAFDMLILTPKSAASRTIPKEMLEKLRFKIKVGDEISIEALTEKLVSAGYSRCEMVNGVGQFAVRGSIVDIYSPTSPDPFRIDFWGDDIDSLATFDANTQRRIENIDEITIVPAAESSVFDREGLIEKLNNKLESKNLTDKRREVIFRDIDMLKSGISVPADRYPDEILGEYATVLDYFDGITFLCDTARASEALEGNEKFFSEDIEQLTEDGLADSGTKPFHLSKNEFYEKLANKNTIIFESMPRTLSEFALKNAYTFTLKQLSPAATISGIVEDVPKSKSALTVILAGEKRTAESIIAALETCGIKAEFREPDGIGKKGVFVTTGILSQGFEIPAAEFTLIAFGRAKILTRKSRFKKGGDIGSLDELHSGDAVVHSVHGIGIFEGIVQMNAKGIMQDYIKIRYRGTDALYVPVTSLDMVSRYIGTGDKDNIKLNKLGSQEWTKTRRRVKAAVKDIAKQLTALYAKRLEAKGFAFAPDCDMQRDFEARFPYDETRDQLKAVDEIKADMEAGVPMDRLLCGDVGFGKTEVALRAAFKAIANGKQVAILVPTTILAWQHYTTALERFSSMAVNVEMLSRFRTPTQQTKIKKKLAVGNIDLIVGTHKLISADVKFKDLGLLIIDEEQRFGVAQKEKLKELHPNVDVLTLSATPIPRTLNMALSGLRDMSSIEEAPHDRLPVQTYVMEYNYGVVFDAIAKELSRGGQVYYLYNKVESISAVAARIQHRFPENTVAIAHGQMGEEELSSVWKRLLEGEIDILVCTTIIETGVDVPNVNTLIIEDADRFGLSQLHQLRGRVGRSHRRAYAYFLFKMGKVLTDISSKRLEAIREFTEFGSGYRIALRDLELRGAGSVLGGEQHGHMESVGYDMYLKLLGDAIAEEKGETAPSNKECTIDIRSAARIPEKYITDLSQRLEMYRKIASIRTEEDKLDVTDELIDRFGEPPELVIQLMNVSLLKTRCIGLRIQEVTERNERLILYTGESRPDMLLALVSKFGNKVSNIGGEKPCITIKTDPKKPTLELLGDALCELEAFFDGETAKD